MSAGPTILWIFQTRSQRCKNQFVSCIKIALANHPCLVSFISDNAQGRVLQQAFSVCPKSDDESLKDRYNRLLSELTLLHGRIDYENQVDFNK